MCVVNRLLLSVCCLLLFVVWRLSMCCLLLFVDWYPLSVGCCMLRVVCWLLFVGRCLRFGDRSLCCSFVVGCALCVVFFLFL